MSRIHPVISVAHLEPLPRPGEDPFNRTTQQAMSLSLIPEKILNKRTLHPRGDGMVTEYLVRYKGHTV